MAVGPACGGPQFATFGEYQAAMDDDHRRKAERLLRDVERQIMAQESCGVCARDHDGCYVGESLRIVRSLRLPQVRGCPMTGVLGEVALERASQDAKWGEQNHPDGTGLAGSRLAADQARAECEWAFPRGIGTWRHIFMEEVCEAIAESDPARLRAELVQVAAVAVAWVEAIDRRACEVCGDHFDPKSDDHCPVCHGSLVLDRDA